MGLPSFSQGYSSWSDLGFSKDAIFDVSKVRRSGPLARAGLIANAGDASFLLPHYGLNYRCFSFTNRLVHYLLSFDFFLFG
jgi:hypothetical protein